MFREATPLQYAAAMLATALCVILVCCLLPTQPYARFRAVANTDYIKAGWIYERLNFDPTPIDFAFVGSSRTLLGIDSEQIENAINADGAHWHVENIALPHLAQDLPYLTVRLLLEKKRPRILFLETDYIGDWHDNPVYPLLCDLDDLIPTPVALINPHLPMQIVEFSARRAKLFLSALIGASAGTDTFDAAAYRGQHWNDVYITTNHDGVRSTPRLKNMEKAAFDKAAKEWVASTLATSARYRGWVGLQHGRDDYFLRSLLDVAKNSGTRIVFLYQPAVGSPADPFKSDMLRRYGEIWPMPEAVTADYTLWSNPTHLNYRGAEAYSAWISQELKKVVDASAGNADAGNTIGLQR